MGMNREEIERRIRIEWTDDGRDSMMKMCTGTLSPLLWHSAFVDVNLYVSAPEIRAIVESAVRRELVSMLLGDQETGNKEAK